MDPWVDWNKGRQNEKGDDFSESFSFGYRQGYDEAHAGEYCGERGDWISNEMRLDKMRKMTVAFPFPLPFSEENSFRVKDCLEHFVESSKALSEYGERVSF